MSQWRCLQTLNPDRPEYCIEFGLNEAYMEQNFMRMLNEIQQHPDLRSKVEEVVDRLTLDAKELQVQQELLDEMEALNQELYAEVDEQLNERGQDTRRVDYLTGEIIRRREAWKEFTDRTEAADTYRKELTWLLNEVKTLGRAVGVEYGISLTRQAYLEEQAKRSKAAEQEVLLQSEEVQQILEYCREPKTFGELYSYLPIRSTNFFRRRVINPLLERGRLKRCKGAEVGGGRYPKYLSEW